ncbi:HK97 gp10 family phage protein [Microbacterium sp. 2FI]|uniref:HK97 gp10 family phage protein n=1 Tax=Microbacterium sp. 2FI TaxID=2502193 RepID=UPI0010F5E3EC|nr:HK97 gp10 family phage protein [Microbacterium sp. 2FI]
MAQPVKFNNAYFEQLSRSPGVVRITVEAAQRIAATARATAPSDTQAYRNGIRVRVKYQRRAVALVEGRDKKTMLIESKTGNLARALRANARGRR